MTDFEFKFLTFDPAAVRMDAVLQANLSSVHAPLGGDRVYKDECIYSYQTPVRMHDVMLSLLLPSTWCDQRLIFGVITLHSSPSSPRREREGSMSV